MLGEEKPPEDADGVFRVRVSMERYFSDERARVYMSVSRGRAVRSLARRLRRAFLLPRPFALVSHGHLLPPLEPLAVLLPDDPVEVIPTTTLLETHMGKNLAAVQKETLDLTMEPEHSPPSLLHSPVSPPHSPVSPPRSLVSPPRSPVSPPRSPVLPASPRADEVDAPTATAGLEDMKRRALEILSGYETVEPRRRRRVRRHRRRRPAAPSPCPSPCTHEDRPSAAARAVEATTIAEPVSQAVLTMAVVRNEAAGAEMRAARLVRLLAEPAAAPYSVPVSAELET